MSPNPADDRAELRGGGYCNLTDGRDVDAEGAEAGRGLGRGLRFDEQCSDRIRVEGIAAGRDQLERTRPRYLPAGDPEPAGLPRAPFYRTPRR